MVLSKCFLERGIVKKEEIEEKEEVLELDIVATSYSENSAEKCLIEIKGGKNWGYSDLFKIRGWLDYLGFNKARFIVQETNGKPINTIQKEIAKLNIDLVVNCFDKETGRLNNNDLCLSLGIEDDIISEKTIEMLCYSFLLEDMMCDKLIRSYRESDLDNKKRGYDRLFLYLQRIKHSSFFCSDPIKRVDRIINAYFDNANITARIACERKGDDFESIDRNAVIPSDIFKEIYHIPQNKSGYHISLYVEFLNKLLILKCCIDYHMAKQIDNPDDGLPEWIKRLKIAALPDNLKEGIGILSVQPYCYLYPHFWQVFVYLFGGFILEDKKEEEYKHLSLVSGIPVEHIDNALSCFDILFKTEGGWFTTIDGIRIIKLFPSPFSGIGANYRLELYINNDDSSFGDLKKVVNEKTFKRLASWNNLAVDFLKTDKNVVIG